ncbi:BspA family leucine-rich repeat surface protein [Bifidobacterium sp. ESL0769]|uniref:BspA family leucine-rich repeat surface protein n=1 Tax=Bifidobacterium sp. ESL0769 TaxID=2983229 RepID=UPI0023F659C2|nr:BspA family leucine-rich repeat surface protein [Bifidobacterium sp. ESL0769]WEV67104.1 BspA family leucine-rich repeat surface protein [Bifidobacterium sp. ESL0769]
MLKKKSAKLLGAVVATAMLFGPVIVFASADETPAPETQEVSQHAQVPTGTQTGSAQAGSDTSSSAESAKDKPVNPGPGTGMPTQAGKNPTASASDTQADSAANSERQSGTQSGETQVQPQVGPQDEGLERSSEGMWGNAHFTKAVEDGAIVYRVDGGNVGGVATAPWRQGVNPPDSYITVPMKIIFTDPANTHFPADSSKIFWALGGLTEIDGIGDVDVSGVTNMSGMFDSDPKLDDLSSLSHWGASTHNVTDMSDMFSSDIWHDSSDTTGPGGIAKIGVSGWDTSNVTNMYDMFQYDERVETLDVGGWNTSNVTNMGRLFVNCVKLRNPDVSHWNTSKVTNMEDMFSSMNSGRHAPDGINEGITRLDVTNWDVSNVKNMTNLFAFSAIGSVGGEGSDVNISKWDVGNVTEFTDMFGTMPLVTDIDLSYWGTRSTTTGLNKTHNVTNLQMMFSFDPLVKHIDLRGWDVANVDDMLGMFDNEVNNSTPTSQLKTIDGISAWKTPKLGFDLTFMFAGNDKLVGDRATSDGKIDLSGWDTSHVRGMDVVFTGTKSLTTVGDIGKWDTSNVKKNVNWTNDGSMSRMFESSAIENLDLSYRTDAQGNRIRGWDTSGVYDMSYMFLYNKATNINLAGWDTSNVENMIGMFYAAFDLYKLDLSGWDLRKATTANQMFNSTGASSGLLLNLSDWKTSSSTDMRFMFCWSGLLSLDLSGWTEQSLQDMSPQFPYTLQRLTIGPDTKLSTAMFGWNGTVQKTAGDPYQGVIDGTNWSEVYSGEWGEITDDVHASLTCTVSGVTHSAKGEEWNSCGRHDGASSTSALVARSNDSHPGTYVWESKATVHFAGLNPSDAANAQPDDTTMPPRTIYGVRADGKIDGGTEVKHINSLQAKVPASRPNKDHKTFAGWKLDGEKDSHGKPVNTVHQQGDSVTLTPGSSNILRGQWRDIDKYQVTLEPGNLGLGAHATLNIPSNIIVGGSSDSVPFVWLTVPKNVYSVTSDDYVYTLTGWNTRPDGSGPNFPAMDSGVAVGSGVGPYVVYLSQGKPQVTLYAQWKRTGKTAYKLSFEANATDIDTTVSGMPGQQEVKDADNSHTFTFVGTKPTRVSSDPADYEWEFTGWSTVRGDTGGDTPVVSGSQLAFTVGKDHPSATLYAHWKKVHQYTLSFDANAPAGEITGSTSTGDIKQPSDSDNSSVKVPNDAKFERNGYKFMGWNEKPDGTGSVNYAPEGSNSWVGFDAGASRTRVTLYAQWSRYRHHTLTYDYQAGGDSTLAANCEGVTLAPGQVCSLPTASDSGDSDLNDYTNVAITPITPMRNDWTFIGWTQDKDGKTRLYNSGDLVSVGSSTSDADSNVLLYAQWVPKVDYSLSFTPGKTVNITQGFGTMTQRTSTGGAAFVIPSNYKYTAEETGSVYRFVGWTQPGDSHVYQPGETVYTFHGHENILMTAKWQYTYSLTFQGKNKGIGSSKKVAKVSRGPLDEAKTELTVPNDYKLGMKDDSGKYQFTGWQDSKDKQVYNPGQKVKMDSHRAEISLAAQWALIPVTPASPDQPKLATAGPARLTPTPSPVTAAPAVSTAQAMAPTPHARAGAPAVVGSQPAAQGHDGQAPVAGASPKKRIWKCNTRTGKMEPVAYLAGNLGYNVFPVAGGQGRCESTAQSMSGTQVHADFPWWIILLVVVALMLTYARYHDRFQVAQHRGEEID